MSGAAGAGRGEPAVVIPVLGAPELFERCLASVLDHTPAEVPIVVADDATPGDAIATIIGRAGAASRLLHHRQPETVGFPRNVNAALAATAPADPVILNSDCEVAAGWLESLQSAAYSDSRVATVSTLTNHGTIVSVPERNRPGQALPAGHNVESAAAAIRSGARRLLPRLPTAIGHCFHVRRSALELVGDFDPAFSPGYGEEVDFSQRCLARGLIHLLADDVFVYHRGGGSFGGRDALQRRHERMIEERYPYYSGTVARVAREEDSALADALAAARRALRGLTVTVDATALGPTMMGTQVATLELVRALAERRDLELRVVVSRAIAPEAWAPIERLGVETIRADELERGVERTDVVHRPNQLFEPKQLDWLHRLGERVVVSFQDLIAYDNPSYFEDAGAFDANRSLARQSLAIADGVVFISRRVLLDAVAEELVTADRAHAVLLGADHAAELPAPRRPDVALEPGEYLLCLGADLRHKNRLFALRMLEALRAEHGYTGKLVLAGPHLTPGSSRAEEDRYVEAQPALRGQVVHLDEVSEAEKAWLYRGAALVLYPTVAEGFGLVPFEAAAAGVACMFAPEDTLAEVLEGVPATIVPWDVAESARAAAELLEDRGRREGLVASVRERSRALTWARTAEQLVEIYRSVCERPAQPARRIFFGEAIDNIALSLVGPGGYLPPEIQRALLAVATRPALRRPFFATLDASYKALRRRGEPVSTGPRPSRAGTPTERSQRPARSRNRSPRTEARSGDPREAPRTRARPQRRRSDIRPRAASASPPTRAKQTVRRGRQPR